MFAIQVIQEWADFDSAGYTFERGRMEKNIQAICMGDHAASTPAHIAAGPAQGQKLKRDDVDFIVSRSSADYPSTVSLRYVSPLQTLELLIPRHIAEATLAKHNGDFKKALDELVQAPQNV